MPKASSELVLLTPVLPAKQSPTLLLRVLPESGLCHGDASLAQKTAQALPGEALPGSVTAWLPLSLAPAPAIPCLIDSCSARADCVGFPRLDTPFAWGVFALAVLSARSISKPADKHKQQTRSTHSSLFILQLSDHVAQTLSLFSRSLPSSPGCACLLNPPTPTCSPALFSPGKAIALSWDVRSYGSWHMLVYSPNSELFDGGQGGAYFLILYLEQYLAQEGIYSIAKYTLFK